MQLVEWMRENTKTADDMARSANISAQAVYKYISGHRTPSRKVMRKLFEVTGGEVTANDFFDLQKTS